MRWTAALDEQLKRLYDKGFGNGAIAQAITTDIGVTVTEDAVKNRAARIGLQKDLENGAAALFSRPRQYEHLSLSRLRDGSRVVIAFNDMQIPFHDQASMAAVLTFVQDFEPTHLIVPGDGFDFYTISAFDMNPSRQFHFKEELEIGHGVIKRIEAATSRADRYWIDGNHEDRLRKWLWKHGAMISGLPSLEPQKLLHLDSWTHLTYGSSISVMGVVVEHGDGGGANMAHRMFAKRGTSGVCGHSHRMHDLHVTNAGGAHRYIENGCLCSLTPEYVARPNWQHGFSYGLVVGGRLRLFPTLVERDGFRAEGHWYKRREQ